MRDTDIPIVQHAVLYGMTYLEPVQKQFFPVTSIESPEKFRKTAGDALNALDQFGYLNNFPLPGRRKGYHPGPKAATLVGDVSKYATAPPGTQALTRDLAINWWCHMKTTHAHKLISRELTELFPENPPTKQNVVHCLRTDNDKTVVYRMYLATANTPKRAREGLASICKEAIANKSVLPWLESGEYGFAVLAPTKGVAECLRREIKVMRRKLTTLPDAAPIILDLTAFPETLTQAIQAYRESLSKHSESNAS